MKNIQMVDVKSQYLKIKQEIDAAILGVIEETSFINGPAVKNFAIHLGEYLGGAKVIPCANGTDALQIAMMALDLKPGDEVIVPAFTYVATAEVIGLLGLHPVMVDVDPETFNVDPKEIEKAITSKTRAIVPVHLFGQIAEMDKIMNIADQYGLYVIEDNAQALGAFYKDGRKSGTIGHIGCTSFYPSKNLGAYGDGGAIMTRDEKLGEKLWIIANHGQRKRYYHDLIGVNSRLDSIQAAILDIKLLHLDEYAAARQKAAAYYDHSFSDHSGIKTPVRSMDSNHVFHQYTLKVPSGDRDTLQEFLQSKGVPTMVYYPVPLYKQEAFKGYLGGSEFELPVTEDLCKTVISLPMHTEMTEEILEYICFHVKEYFNHGS
ncbi:MAG: UDP-4-amino-4-deoxy-L-arabinose--oxoglutarate aminotransferase [Bacteroidota bacterium]